jgi:hypothetical protein
MQRVVNADLLRSFKPPPELARSRPRDVRLTTNGRLLLALAWLLAAAAIAAGVGLYIEARKDAVAEAALTQRGVVTSATVDRVWRDKGDGKAAYAAFHFDASGTRVTGQSRMQVSRWQSLRTGSVVPLRYLPDDPRTFVIDGARRNRVPMAVPYLVGGLLAIAAFLSAAGVRRQRRLLMEGRAAPAVVTEVRKHHSGHGASHRVMSYEFPLLGGGLATGKAYAISKSTEVGATICVVYDPDVPRRSRPYPLSMVKVDVGPF